MKTRKFQIIEKRVNKKSKYKVIEKIIWPLYKTLYFKEEITKLSNGMILTVKKEYFDSKKEAMDALIKMIGGGV